MTWAILIWIVLFLWVTLSLLADNESKDCKGSQTCVGLTQAGNGLAVAAAIVIGVVGFFALLVAWFATSPQRRSKDVLGAALNLLGVLVGGFLTFVGVVGLAASGDPWFGGAFAALGLLSLMFGLGMLALSGSWWYRRFRRSPLPDEASVEET